MNVRERNEKFYTEEGINALRARLKGFINLYNKNEFPFEFPVLDFCRAKILTREDCEKRIIELSELIGYPLKKKKEVENINGEDVIVKEEIIYSEKWQ